MFQTNRSHSGPKRRVTLAQKVGNQPADPVSPYDYEGLTPEEEDALINMAPEMDFDPNVAGTAKDEGGSFDDLLSEYGQFGVKDVNELYNTVGERSKKDYDEAHKKKVGSGEGMRGFNRFEDAAKGGDIPEGIIDDVMKPGNESEDLIYGLTEASSEGAEGGREGPRPDVAEPRTAEGESIYDVLGSGKKPAAVIKEKTAVIPGGLAKNPFPEDSKLGKMFRAIEARGKPGGHELGRVKRPRI